MYPRFQALLLGLLVLVVGATPAPSATPSPTPTTVPGATKTSAKLSCHAGPPSCEFLFTEKTICAPYSNHKQPCKGFCRKIQFAFWKKARQCKSKNKSRFSTLFYLCRRKCALVRRTAVAAARKGIPFDGVVTISGRRDPRRPRRGSEGYPGLGLRPGGTWACWYCRHHGTHCRSCCGSKYWCPDW